MKNVDLRRVRVLKESEFNREGPVLYWMQRDQRAEDNWALLYAQEIALKNGVPLLVVFNLVPSFLGATLRQYDFMLRGLFETRQSLAHFNIPLLFTFGEPRESIAKVVKDLKTSCVVTDFNPLRIVRSWKKEVVELLDVPVYEVDSHNIVPAFFVSQKGEYSARTFRSKIMRVLGEFLTDFPTLSKMPSENLSFEQMNNFKEIDEILRLLKIDREILPVQDFQPGSTAAYRILEQFLKHRLKFYHRLRNDPVVDGTSDLSPYLHFGQIAPQRVALQVAKFSDLYTESVSAFLEELVVRRELAENFCLYNQDYDSTKAFPRWARESLKKHEKDKKPYIYTLSDLENARTHDELWNAAQRQMVKTGKMHGYVRMYWAKKILEWSDSPEKAVEYAVYLNDKYELDGRDPNGYTGIAWAIGGVHDKPWRERAVFGKIRYMSYEGCKRKFDVAGYIAKYSR
ncbi:MAG: deoxyribodipyrimidine photo-lyase [Pseudothermotoga sp.]